MREAKDFLGGLLRFAAFIAVGFLLFELIACAGLASFVGVETAADTEQKIKAVHAALDVAGPWGSLLATGISAVLLAANHAYRNKTRRKALAAKH